MKTQTLTCIECPQGCQLTIGTDGRYILGVTGHKCPKGKKYAQQEIENPQRLFTSTVAAEGLDLKMLPVKTSQPIPKSKQGEVMEAVRRIRVAHPVKAGEVIAANFAGLGVDLVATRSAEKTS